ncbi:MAG: ABC transporter transmembrane domain-containing protein, partial [Pseudomonadota bacterium]
MSAPLPRIGDDGRARGIAAVAALSLGQAAAAGAAAIATRHLFGVLGGRTPTDAPGTDAAPAGAPNALAALAALPAETVALAAVALAGLAIAACRVGERVAAERVGHRYAEALRLALFAHLMRLPVRTLAARRTGSLTLRYTGDLGAIRGWVSLGLARLISAAIVLPGALAAVAWINPALGAAAAASLAAGVAAMAAVAACHAGTHGKARRAQAGLAAHMAERVPQAPVLRLMGRAAVERAALAKRSARMTETALDRARGDALMRAVADVVAGL